MKFKVSVIILHWGERECTISCLESLKKMKHPRDLEITTIVVDNRTRSSSYFKKFPHIKILSNQENLGWSGGNNVGIKFALKNKADYVVLLNNDIKVEKNFLIELLEVIESGKTIGIVGPKTYYMGNKNLIADAGGFIQKHRYFGSNKGQGEKDEDQYNKRTKVDFISGSTMLIKASVIKNVGFFDERFFLYYEDVDFCLRAKKLGFKSVFVPEAIVYHEFGASSKIGSPLHKYYNTRNHYLFVEKHAPWTVKFREILRTPKTFWEFVINKDIFSILGICDYYLRRFGKRVYW